MTSEECAQELIYVKNKFTGETYKKLEETGIEASRAMFDRALRGSKIMKDMPSHKGAEILEATAAAVLKNQRRLAKTIAIEAMTEIKLVVYQKKKQPMPSGPARGKN